MTIFNNNNIFNSAKKAESQANSDDKSALKLLDWMGDVYETMGLFNDTSGNGFYRGKKIAEIISRFFGNPS